MLAEGLGTSCGSIFDISEGEVPTYESAQRMTPKNPFLADLAGFDLALSYILFGSIMAIFWGHDLVCGEKEAGTLRLVLANPVSRHLVLAGKILGALASLLAPVLVSYLVCCAIILNAGVGEYGAEGLFVFVLFLVGLACFISVCFSASVMFSVMADRKRVSFLWSLLYWVVLIIVYPSVVPHLVEDLAPIPKREVLLDEIGSLNEEFKDRVRAIEADVERSKGSRFQSPPNRGRTTGLPAEG
jgi:ABC-type transport system involved in multi-copper enzyme maturation permease subunit